MERNSLVRRRSWLASLAFLGALGAATASFAADAATFLHDPTSLPSFVFEDEAGSQHTLTDYRGQYVLLNIWAVWCGPCVKEMPSLDGLQAHFDVKKLRVLTVSEDRSVDAVSAFFHTHGIKNLPVLRDNAGTAPSALHLSAIPVSLLIDPQGREIGRLEGSADWASPKTLQSLDTLLSR